MLAVAPIALAYAAAAAISVAWLHVRRRVRTPYTRKIFHFLILSAALIVQLRWGVQGTVVYGSVVVLMVLAAVLRGDGFAFYEALARPSDAPHRSLFIVAPLLTTAAGGVLANLLFPAWAFVGYAAVAWGDAIGEPVGTRWGRHRYRVPSLAGVVAWRSVEGSMAVLAASAAAAALALTLTGAPAGQALRVGLFVGIATVLVEAVSHHGLDNLTIQVAAAAVAALLSG
jgi:phytol kinase